MDKKTVALLLEVSEKSVSRYAAAGKLPSRYIQGKNGKQLEFDEADILKFKEDLSLPFERAIVKDSGAQPNPDAGTTLATLPRPDAAALAFLARLQAIGQPNPGQPESNQEIAAKMLLTLEEARRLTGLSRAVLVDAIKAGELRALTIGRGYKLRPDDIEDWIEKMFKSASKGKK